MPDERTTARVRFFKIENAILTGNETMEDLQRMGILKPWDGVIEAGPHDSAEAGDSPADTNGERQ